MIFVIGGRRQGKTGFACSLTEKLGESVLQAAGKERPEYPRDERAADGRTVSYEIADGRTDPFEAAMTARMVLHLESYIRRVMEGGADPYDFADRLIKANPGAVLTADEIGYGVVPIDAFEREYRDTDGRVCQRIAAFSDEVYRVVCGIGIRIK